MYRFEDYQKAADFLRTRMNKEPEIGLVLGSGLGFLEERVTDKVLVDYADIPGFVRSTVESHKGRLVFGTLSGKPVVLMQGRFHFYEGYTMEQTVFPIRVMKLLGVKTLVATNAAGGINKGYEPGDLMLISDHIKFFDDSPLRGANLPAFGIRFNDMSYAYTPRLRELVKQAARELSINLKEGVYAYMPGPQFETPAEIRALRTLGADAVGMSTVAEVITAAHAGLEVLGISCIWNMAAGILAKPLSDDEVVEVANREKERFSRLVLCALERM